MKSYIAVLLEVVPYISKNDNNLNIKFIQKENAKHDNSWSRK